MIVVPRLVLNLSHKDCEPPHGVTDPSRLSYLMESLDTYGWMGPYLLGYPLDGYIQLVSGSHRYEACKLLGRTLPVAISSYDSIERLWGSDEWVDMMLHPPTVPKEVA